MRLKLTILLLIILIIYTTVNVQAQKPATTLSQQYKDVVTNAGSYQGFKEIRQDKLDLLWKNVSDSLNKERALLAEAKAKLGSNDQAALSTKAELENAKKELALSKARLDQISVLGLYMEKGTYNSIMWGLVFLLTAGLAFAIYRTSSSLKEARYRTGLYNDLSEEFQKHKVNANEKEKKLARELQTERNRIAELTGR
jgi:signal transduction histidine kinase